MDPGEVIGRFWSCPADIPHGEHGWIRSDGSQARCPGQDTGDVSGLHRKFCRNEVLHKGHLWEKRGALKWCPGLEQIKVEWSGKVGSKGEYTFGQFVEDFGEKFASCKQNGHHRSHAWFNDEEGPGGGKNQWWWCRGMGKASPSCQCHITEPHKSHFWDNKSRHCPGIEIGEQTVFGKVLEEPDPYQPNQWCEGRLESPPGGAHDPHNWVKVAEGQPHGLYCPGWSGEASVDVTPELRGMGDKSDLSGGEVDSAPQENRSLPVRWADRAMFKAEPIAADEGPKVYLLWMTPDPLGAIAAACKMYKGEVVRDLSTVTDGERLEYLAQVRKTKLKAPFEFVKFHFVIEGVTRSFTHQMVRQRTAVYAQESLRFAVVTAEGQDMPVGLPPSLSWLDETDPARLEWDNAVSTIEGAYDNLVNMYGVPAEDARGLLPHSVLTRLHYSTDLRALLDHAGNRLCTQAQFEWRLVFAKIVEAIRAAGDYRWSKRDGSDMVYMADCLADLFKPVCYQTGKCEFKADFDRACKIRDRVDAFSAQGVPPSEWEKGNGLSGAEHIPGIKPGEWLLDPNAARER